MTNLKLLFLPKCTGFGGDKVKIFHKIMYGSIFRLFVETSIDNTTTF